MIFCDSSWIVGPRRCLANVTLDLRLVHRIGVLLNLDSRSTTSNRLYFFSKLNVRFMSSNLISISCCFEETFKLWFHLKGQLIFAKKSNMVFSIFIKTHLIEHSHYFHECCRVSFFASYLFDIRLHFFQKLIQLIQRSIYLNESESRFSLS